MTRLFASLLGLACLAAPVFADGPSKAKIGEKISNLTFEGEKGAKLALHDLKDKEAIVIVFFSFECPVSNSYCQPLTDMQKEFGKSGVQFIGLTVNDDDTAAHVAKQAREFNLTFPVFRDRGLVAGRALEADFTPECFVLDSEFKLVYRGRIDNSYSARLKKHQQVTKHDLRQVIGEVLSGRPVFEPATQAIGCPIVRDTPKVAADGKVTYHRDVLPILQNNCQSCHRPGEVGPFSLMTYKQAVNWAQDIKQYTASRQMPPWKPAGGVAMHGERRLSDAQIKTLAHWADNGTPAGDPKDAPQPVKFTQGWQLGTPDVVLSPAGDTILGPTGKDLFRCFVMPTNLPEDVSVSAVELRPGNPQIVHHLLLFVDTQRLGRKFELAEKDRKPEPPDPDHPKEERDPSWDTGPGYTSAMGPGFVPQSGMSGWSPGITPRHLPEGTGFFLPKGADVVMQIHYHRNGRVERDKTQVGLYLRKKPVERPYVASQVAGKGPGPVPQFFMIPPGKSDFKLTGERWAGNDFMLYSISPHMHMIGKSIKFTMTPPDGKPQVLVDIPQWDYNWQEIYFFKDPIAVKKGTKFEVEAIYDNSSKNPFNPSSPPRLVTFGEQTTNEMCFVFMGGTADPGPNGRARRLPMVNVDPLRKSARK